MRRSLGLLVAASVLSVSACGGGGGSPAPRTLKETCPDAEAAFAPIMDNGLTGTDAQLGAFDRKLRALGARGDQETRTAIGEFRTDIRGARRAAAAGGDVTGYVVAGRTKMSDRCRAVGSSAFQ